MRNAFTGIGVVGLLDVGYVNNKAHQLNPPLEDRVGRRNRDKVKAARKQKNRTRRRKPTP